MSHPYPARLARIGLTIDLTMGLGGMYDHELGGWRESMSVFPINYDGEIWDVIRVSIDIRCQMLGVSGKAQE